MLKIRRLLPLFFVGLLLMLSACGGGEKSDEKASGKGFTTQSGKGEAFTIAAGSENKVLEPLVEAFSKKTGYPVHIDYMGSLDIMRMLESGNPSYDALWPASSIWLEMGDKDHLLKHTKTVALTPVIFGIRKSLAEELGYVGRNDITIEEISKAIADGKLRFAMTSATQSNSGASAYLAFLTSLSKNPQGGLTSEDLLDPSLQKKITHLLSGVNRSSGSSNWLVDLFLMGNYDAMVNYEQLIIQTNQALEKQGKEPLYAIYPIDGLSISDSPLAYVDHGKPEKEQCFLSFQNDILSDQGQSFIESTGKRNAYGKVADKNRSQYKKEWGIDVDRTLSPIRLPQISVIEEALSLYQTSFKKPAYTAYVLDYSGSMEGVGNAEMIRAIQDVWIPKRAKENMLLGSDRDQTLFIPFSSFVMDVQSAEGADLSNLASLAEKTSVGGGTALYEATAKAMEEMSKVSHLCENYSPAIVLLTDGKANGNMNFDQFAQIYQSYGLDIPIFSIQFGNANEKELKNLAKLTHARVFNGRKNLAEAFRSVKGYN